MRAWKRLFAVMLAVTLVSSFSQAANASPSLDPPIEVEDPGQVADPETGDAGTAGDVAEPESEEGDAGDGVKDDPELEHGDDLEAQHEGHDEPDRESDAGQDEAVDGEAGSVVSTPDSLEIEGRLRVIPAEPTQASAERRASAKKQKRSKEQSALEEVPIEDQRFELGPEDIPEELVASVDAENEDHLEMIPERVLLETDDGVTLPLDPETVGPSAVGGARFAGAVAVNSAAEVSVTEAIAEAPEQALAETEVIEVAADATVAAAETFSVLDSEITPLPVPLAPGSPVMHSADVVFFTNATTSQETAVRSLMTLTSNYWKRESEGLIAGIKVNAVKQIKLAAGMDPCEANTLWQSARDLFSNPGYYENARHLVIFVDAKCSQDSVGLGDVLDLHAGGETWVNLGARRSGDPITEAVHILHHELGHNFGLLHSGSRSCADYRVFDTSVSNTWFANSQEKNPNKLCTDQEYADPWSVMGYYDNKTDSNSPSLPIGQKVLLGVPSNQILLDAKSSGGTTQRFTIKALSSGTGVRGVRVQQSSGSEPFFLEYRNGVGSDSRVNEIAPEEKGVRVHKTRERTGIGIHTLAGTALRTGQSLHPYGGRARVTVESATSAQAVVRVDFHTSFTDVMLSDRFASSIQWMFDKKISTGSLQPDKSVMYGPKVDVSREAVAAFFFRAYAPAGYKPGGKGKLPFTDVTTTHKFYPEIYWMWERGITTGTKQADGTVKYLPGDALTREAVSAFLYRAEAASFTPPSKSPFVDVPTTHTFYKYIAWMYAKGISTGTVTPAGREYQPKVNTTREAMAPFMQRASQL